MSSLLPRTRALSLVLLVGCTGSMHDSQDSGGGGGLSLTILSPAEGERLDGLAPVVLYAEVQDDKALPNPTFVVWETDVGGWLANTRLDLATGASSYVTTLPAGHVLLQASVNDADGNKAWRTHSVRVDVSAPQVEWREPLDNSITEAARFLADISDDASDPAELELELWVDEVEMSPAPTALADGTLEAALPADLTGGWHEATVVARDTFGRESTTPSHWLQEGNVIESPADGAVVCASDPIVLSAKGTTGGDSLEWGTTSSTLATGVAGDVDTEVTLSAGSQTITLEVSWGVGTYGTGGTTTDSVNITVNEDRLYYLDLDGDGSGDPGTGREACGPAANEVELAGDCDDTDPTVYPGAPERCDLIDSDCDGADDVDDPDAGLSDWFADLDNDGFGDAADTLVDCAQPTGYVPDDTDCDDLDAAVAPDQDERCNSIDDDCDGDTDETSAIDALTWYRDADRDDYGDPAASTPACTLPSGYVADSADCDDTNPVAYPGADEYCNGTDDDCDGVTDEDDALNAQRFFPDQDGDGYGDVDLGEYSCYLPAGYVEDIGDCDDLDSDVNPDAIEVCNDVDDDCNGSIDSSDPGVTGEPAWYDDGDGDGYGDPRGVIYACDAPPRYVADNTDCDDTDAGVSPADLEYCDGEDDDCDGTTDESAAVDASTWFADTDSDGYGTTTATRRACSAPAGYLAGAGDCNDAEPLAWTGATEVCDGVDNDCLGGVDNFADPFERTPDDTAATATSMGVQDDWPSAGRTATEILPGGDEDWFEWEGPEDYSGDLRDALVVQVISDGSALVELFKADDYDTDPFVAPLESGSGGDVELIFGEVATYPAPERWYLRITGDTCATSYTVNLSVGS